MDCNRVRPQRMTGHGDPARRTMTHASNGGVGNDADDDGAAANPGEDPRPDPADRPLVACARGHRHRAHDLGALRDRARLPRPVVLGAAVPLSDAVLLAVRQLRLRPRVEQPGHLVPQGALDRALRERVAAVRARLPAELLLLPACLVPGVLAGTDRVRRAATIRALHRGDQVPAYP